VELRELVKKAKGLTDDSRKVKEGYLFFAVKGVKHDGHLFVEEAVRRGAFAVVAERPVKCSVPLLLVENSRKAYGEACHLFFGEPTDLKLIGITGTNGKTTTAHLFEALLTSAGERPALLGTLYYRLGETLLGEGMTTPDPYRWHSLLARFREMGATYAVAEVSSHALDQDRIHPSAFEAAVFTNLSRDHLDYGKLLPRQKKALHPIPPPIGPYKRRRPLRQKTGGRGEGRTYHLRKGGRP